MTENLSPDTLVGDTHVASSNGGGTVESSALSLADLNKHLGSDFKDTATALKALKDTKDYVGKRKDDIVAEVRNTLQPSSNVDDTLKHDVQSLKRDLFFSQNPQYKGLEAVIEKFGGDPAEVVKSPEFTNVFEKVKIADEVANNKSVVSSNSRLSQSKTIIDEAINVANARGTTGEDVATVLARNINQLNNQE